MSVLIKGMEMPVSCISCPHHEHGTIHEWELYCGFTGDYIGHWDDKSLNNGHRPDTCPLVEIPKPQNRPVTWGDVYDSLKVLEALLETIEAEEGTHYGDICDNCADKDICDLAKSGKHNSLITACFGYKEGGEEA